MNTIILITTVFLLIRTSYGKERNSSDYLDSTSAVVPRKSGFRFEDDINFSSLDNTGQIVFEDQPAPFKFEETPTVPDHKENAAPITFQDNNTIENAGQKKRKRRRRRRPRYQVQGPNVPLPGQGQYPGFPNQIGQAPYPLEPGQAFPGVPGYEVIGGRPVGEFNRPYHRPKPSFASEALSTVTGALTSIALYDDYQCVPRLLCEAAGGGALGSSNVLQSVAGLQPLLTLLSAYSGISTSPLFVFGRAVFLGMTSKGNTGSCRYAYPQCPTDTEQLVHYLNNHNGGFFRFFNAPQQQIPQNLEQFYNQLSGSGFGQPNQQNYGYYDPQNPGQQFNNPQLNQNFQNQPQFGLQDPQNYINYNLQNNGSPHQYGIYNPQPNYPNIGQQIGSQSPNSNPQQFGYHQAGFDQQNYGFYNPQHYQSNSYGLYSQTSGPQNPYYADKFGYGYYKKRKPYKSSYGFGNLNYKDNAAGNKIEKRIQNKPNYLYDGTNIDNEDDSLSNLKWTFPADLSKDKVINSNVRGGKELKFPGENTSVNIIDVSYKRKSKNIVFPGSQSSNYVNYYDYTMNKGNLRDQVQSNNVGNTFVGSYNNHNHYLKYNDETTNSNNFNDSDEIQTVYIVRDDPYNPEIVKIRRGQKI